MGILPSKYHTPYKYFSDVSAYKKVFDILHFREGEVGKMYKRFKAIDVDGSSSVGIVEMLIHLHLEKTFFNKRVFSILDADGSGELNFGEFFLGLWNYCSIEQSDFGKIERLFYIISTMLTILM